MLAQVYSETQQSQAEADLLSSVLLFGLTLLIALFYTACLWRIFTKAGRPGWHALVPILNSYTLIKVAGRPGWWLWLTFVPCVGTVVFIVVYLDLAREFGKGSGFGVGLVVLSPVFLPILAFGSAQYGLAADRYRPTGVGISPGGYGMAPSASPAFGSAWGPTSVPGAVAPRAGWPDAAPTVLPPLSAVVGPGPVDAGPPTGPDASPEPSAAPDRSAAPVAGWYTDPVDAQFVRWWDGTSWTAHSQERPGAERDS